MAFPVPATKPAAAKPTSDAAMSASPAAPQTGKEPFGQSGATQATPNAGYDAAALQRVGVAIKIIQDAMNMVGASSEMGQKLLKALNDLVKMVPTGTVTPAGERNTLENAQMRNTQNMAQTQQLKQQQMQPQGQAA